MVICSGVTPGTNGESYVISESGPGLTACKSNASTPVLSFQPARLDLKSNKK